MKRSSLLKDNKFVRKSLYIYTNLYPFFRFSKIITTIALKHVTSNPFLKYEFSETNWTMLYILLRPRIVKSCLKTV